MKKNKKCEQASGKVPWRMEGKTVPGIRPTPPSTFNPPNIVNLECFWPHEKKVMNFGNEKLELSLETKSTNQSVKKNVKKYPQNIGKNP